MDSFSIATKGHLSVSQLNTIVRSSSSFTVARCVHLLSLSMFAYINQGHWALSVRHTRIQSSFYCVATCSICYGQIFFEGFDWLTLRSYEVTRVATPQTLILIFVKSLPLVMFLYLHLVCLCCHESNRRQATCACHCLST